MFLSSAAISLHWSLITIDNTDLTCHHHYLPEHDQSRGYLSNINWDPAMAVKLPRHSQQLLALFDLLDTLKADSADHLVGDAQSKSVGGQGQVQGQGQGKAAFKGIIFVEHYSTGKGCNRIFLGQSADVGRIAIRGSYCSRRASRSSHRPFERNWGMHRGHFRRVGHSF